MQDLHIIIPALLGAHYLRLRARLWLSRRQMLSEGLTLFYRLFDRIKERSAKVQFMKASLQVPGQQYLEYSLSHKKLQLNLNPFSDSETLSEDQAFKAHLENFPRLLLKELTIKSGQLRVIAVFKEGYGPESLKSDFPEDLRNWFLRTAEFLKKTPGRKQTSWLIKLDQYTEYLLQNPFLLLAFCFMSFLPAIFFPLAPMTGPGPRTIPLLYQTGIGIIFLTFFLTKKNLLVRSVSRALIIGLAVVALQLLSVVHKS